MTEANPKETFVPLTYLRWVGTIMLSDGSTANVGPSVDAIAGYQLTLTHAWILRELVQWRIGHASTEETLALYLAQKCAKNGLSIEESRSLLMLLDLDDSVLDTEIGKK